MCWTSEWMNEWNTASANSVFIKHHHHPQEFTFCRTHFSACVEKWLDTRPLRHTIIRPVWEQLSSWALCYWEITPFLCVRAWLISRRSPMNAGQHPRCWHLHSLWEPRARIHELDWALLCALEFSSILQCLHIHKKVYWGWDPQPKHEIHLCFIDRL